MTEDHVRLDALLREAERPDGTIDDAIYTAFRGGLLRHIAMEEKVLLPFVRERSGAPFASAAQLRRDHGEIAKLLVRSPSRTIVDSLREVLARHNPLEEGERGLYAACDAAAGEDAPGLVERLRAQPAVPLAKYYDGPLHRVRRSARD